jgi:small subunit ribosomal protein S4
MQASQSKTCLIMSAESKKCKVCRRQGEKLFLKGEKCFSVKCPINKKPYPPGAKGKRRTKSLSEYGKELKEKQKIKNWYNLSEHQFRNYIKEALRKRKSNENSAEFLIQELESRMDNVVLKLGLASSHSHARQMVSHGHFLINEKPINIPSYKLKVGDKVSVRKNSVGKNVFKDITLNIKKHQAPSWLKLDKTKLEGEVTGKPSLEEVNPPAEISSIFEFYSR